MIDIRGNDGAASGHFRAHKFRRDELRNIRAEAFAFCNLVRGIFERALAAHILPLGNKGHFSRYDACLRILILCKGLAGQATARAMRNRKCRGKMRLADIAIIFRLHFPAIIKLGAATRFNPRFTNTRQTLFQINLRSRVRIGAGRVIDANRRLHRRGMKLDLAEGDAEIRKALRRCENLGAGGQRPGGHLWERVFGKAHLLTPWRPVGR